jgi:hypothetical protein
VSQTGSSPVNVGSNTITVRAVNGYRLLRRQVLPTLGSFRSPWRPHGDVVCVLNTRDGGSIQGYRSIGSLLAPIPTWHRALGLEPNATPEFLTPPGQVAYARRRQAARDHEGQHGAIEVFNVNARPATRGVVGWVRWPRPRPS